MIIGSHVSFKKDTQLVGSVKEALNYGSTTFMFYTGAPQNTNRQAINDDLTKEAINLMKENNIDINNVIVHAPYIINLASNNDFAVTFLKEELKRVEQLGMTKLVLHPGSSVKLSREEGIKNIIDNLNKVGKSNVLILLETMAGKGTELGKTFEEIKEIIDAHKDRHENIGYGTIGFDNLIKIIYHEKLKSIPKILETPYVSMDDNSKEKMYPPYKFEIEMILNKKFNDNLINDIRNYYK